MKAESTHQILPIDEAVLNRKDPIDFWKSDNPFVNILEARIELELHDKEGKKDFIPMTVQDREFKKFMKTLEREIEKDELIRYIRKEFKEMQSLIETFFFEELHRRM